MLTQGNMPFSKKHLCVHSFTLDLCFSVLLLEENWIFSLKAVVNHFLITSLSRFNDVSKIVTSPFLRIFKMATDLTFCIEIRNCKICGFTKKIFVDSIDPSLIEFFKALQYVLSYSFIEKKFNSY